MRSNQNRRMNDFPELQVGFPERNDVRNPEPAIDRADRDLQNMQISGKAPARSFGDMKDQNPLDKKR